MKKLLIMIMALFSFFSTAMSQDFHFIYIQLEDAMNNDIVEKKLNALINDIVKNKGNFVALFANADTKEGVTTKSEVQEKIIKKFSKTSSFMATVASDELDVWLDIFEKNEVCRINNGKMVLKNNVSSITFDMFVGDGFVASEMQNYIIAKFLFANDLQNKNITLNYYNSLLDNSSQLTKEKIQFSDIYQKNNIQIQLK